MLVVQGVLLLISITSMTLSSDFCRKIIPGNLSYHPVVILPPTLTVILDLTKKTHNQTEYSVWNERETVHVGVDLGGPTNTAVHAFWEGEVIEAGINPERGDYGPVIVTRHLLDKDTEIFALFGHLSIESLKLSPIGKKFQKGEVIAWIGDRNINGGWPEHVHFQLSWERPTTHDLPGAVSLADREEALKLYPDPQLILGALY